MKNSKKMSRYVCVFILLLVFSCNPEENDVKPDRASGSEISLNKNGYLEFSSSEIFEKTVTTLSQMESSQVKAWEDRHGFTSLRALFDKGMQEAQQLKKKGNATHADFVMQHPGVFKILDDGYLTQNLFRSDVASVVNKEGIVKIGGALYQFSHDFLKVIGDGADHKIALLKGLTETDASLNILVNKVTWSSGNGNSTARTSYSAAAEVYVTEKEASGCVWKARLSGQLTLATVDNPVYETYCGVQYYYDPYLGRYTHGYTCLTYVARIDKRNYLSANCRTEVEEGFCSWGGYQTDNRYRLVIEGSYKSNGTPVSFYRISDTNTSFYNQVLFANINSGSADITEARFIFRDVNNPKPRRLEMGFN